MRTTLGPGHLPQRGRRRLHGGADAKLTGLPGVVLVSRGPGACNASIAVHTAEQDATPLILLVGQVEKRDLRRNAFQEIDTPTCSAAWRNGSAS